MDLVPYGRVSEDTERRQWWKQVKPEKTNNELACRARAGVVGLLPSRTSDETSTCSTSTMTDQPASVGVYGDESDTDCEEVLAWILTNGASSAIPHARTDQLWDVPALRALDDKTRRTLLDTIFVRDNDEVWSFAADLISNGQLGLRHLCASLPDADSRTRELLDACSHSDATERHRHISAFLATSVPEELQGALSCIASIAHHIHLQTYSYVVCSSKSARCSQVPAHRNQGQRISRSIHYLNFWFCPDVLLCIAPCSEDCQQLVGMQKEETEWYREMYYELSDMNERLVHESHWRLRPVLEMWYTRRLAGLTIEHELLKRRVEALEKLAADSGLDTSSILK